MSHNFIVYHALVFVLLCFVVTGCCCSFNSILSSSTIINRNLIIEENNEINNVDNSTTTMIVIDDGIIKKSIFNCPLLDLKIKYTLSNNNQTTTTTTMSDLSQVNLTQILIDNPSLFSCETFPLINDFYIWTSPFNSTEDKLYGVSDGSKLLCEQSQSQQLDESCQFFSNFSSNEMQFFFPHFEHLVLYNYSNYDPNNWDEIYALNDLFISFFTCFYCTNETSIFKTKIYPEFVAQSNYKEVKNSQWIFKGEPYTLPFYSYTKFVSFCNSVKDVNNNDKYVYARDSCNDGKTTIFEISSSKALMSVEFVFFSLQCFITFAIVTVPIFYGWIKRWNFNRMDINKTVKVWRNVTDMRMTATTFLQLSTIFMVIITAKQIYDSPYVYFFDDYNLTLLLGAFEMCVMANIPILAMFIDTLRRTEKNERETSIGFT